MKKQINSFAWIRQGSSLRQGFAKQAPRTNEGYFSKRNISVKRYLLLFIFLTCFAHASEEMIELKDGTQWSKKEALGIYKKMKKLHKECFTALYDLHYKCEDPNFSFMWGNSKKKLKDYKLIDENKQPNNIVKSIMQNGIQGKHLLIKPVCPFKETPK